MALQESLTEESPTPLGHTADGVREWILKYVLLPSDAYHRAARARHKGGGLCVVDVSTQAHVRTWVIHAAYLAVRG